MNPVYDFTWKGKSAFSDFGIDVLKICSTVIAERRDETHVIAGRSGLIHDQDGAVEEIEQVLTIHLPYEQGRTVAPFEEIRRWLKGYGRLTLSTLPGYFMMARITDLIELTVIAEGFADRKGPVIFRCDPYYYHADVQDIALSEATVIHNPGDTASNPIITLDALGDVDLMIGGQTILLTDLDGPITIDSVLQEAYGYDDAGLLMNMNAYMAGDFPVLPTGDVAISFSLGEGAVLNGITITPNWRDEA